MGVKISSDSKKEYINKYIFFLLIMGAVGIIIGVFVDLVESDLSAGKFISERLFPFVLVVFLIRLLQKIKSKMADVFKENETSYLLVTGNEDRLNLDSGRIKTVDLLILRIGIVEIEKDNKWYFYYQ